MSGLEKAEREYDPVERPYRWTTEGARRMWACYAKRTIDNDIQSGFYPPDFYKQILKIAGAKLKGKSKALDMGCSTGTFMRLLLEKGWEVYGTDLQKAVIERLRRAFSGEEKTPTLKTAKNDKLPFDDESFDVVFCTEVLEHMLDEDRLMLLNEARRVLRVGGVFVASTPYKERLRTVICPECLSSFHPMGHVTCVDESIARRWLLECGLKPIVEKTFPTVLIREQDGFVYRMMKVFARSLMGDFLAEHLAAILCFIGERS